MDKPITGVNVYTEPVDMPDDERMTAAELRCVREWLGLTGEALATLVGVTDRMIRRWEAGTHPIPDGARLQIEHIEETTAEVVERIVAQLKDVRDPAVTVYRTDDEFRADHPALSTMTASWWRMAVMRACQDVPGVVIDYSDGSVDANSRATP